MTTPKFQPSPTVLEPLLWVHVALFLGTPWLLGLSLVGLAVGEPFLPSGVEIFLLVVPAIALPVWLQWQRPFSPFSIWLIAQPIPELTPRQLQILALLRPLELDSAAPMADWMSLLKLVKQRKFRQAWEFLQQQLQSIKLVWHPHGWLAITVGLFLYSVLRHLYQIAPIASEFAPFPPAFRLLGLIWAELFLLASSLVLQMGIACLRILLIDSSQFAETNPFPASQVRNSFTSWGMRIDKLLKFDQNLEASSPSSHSWNFDLDFSFVPQDWWQSLVDWVQRKPIQTKVTREEVASPEPASQPEPPVEPSPEPASQPEPPVEPSPEPASPDISGDQNPNPSTDNQESDPWV